MSRALIATVLASLLAAPAGADVTMDDAAKKATAKSLEWLAGQQTPDGAWGEPKDPKSVALTSFALLAFMSQGHLPGQGLYGPEVAKGARFLVASARPGDGYLAGVSSIKNSGMYSHGIATLVLTELWGMAGDEELKPVLEQAVELIVGSQNIEGGWRYDPVPSAADISVTIMQVMALRAAKNSGLHVPESTLKKAIEYINSCHDADSGGYNYMPGRSDPGYARTAAGMCVLQLTGNYDAKEIARGADYLESLGEDPKHYWYGVYYATHAMHGIGGKRWDEWYTKMKLRLISRQAADGSWGSAGDGGSNSVYGTSIAVLSLSTPLNYLPIFQN